MELSKKAIDAVTLTKRYWSCYDAQEVDDLLDEIAVAAENQYQELQALRALSKEYDEVMHGLSQVLVSAQRIASEMLNKARKECDAELSTLQNRKLVLQQEVAALEGFKTRELKRLKEHLEGLLGGNAPIRQPPVPYNVAEHARTV